MRNYNFLSTQWYKYDEIGSEYIEAKAESLLQNHTLKLSRTELISDIFLRQIVFLLIAMN